MKIALTIPDDLWEIYRVESLERHVDPGDLLRDRLARAVGLDPRDRAIVLTGGRTMQLIEEKLGGGQLKSAEDLLAKVTNLAVIKFGAHEFTITPGQYRELAFRASKTGRSIDQLIESIYQKMQETFFEYVP